MTSKKEICITLLTQGHVNSFIKLFKNNENLPELQLLLVAVENASRSLNEYQIYEATTGLAKYFLKVNDNIGSIENYHLTQMF
jgi:hypothetical protein